MGGLSCGVLYLFVSRTSSVFEGFTPSPFCFNEIPVITSGSVLAVIGALVRWRVYIPGKKFKIVTHCDAFTMTMKKKRFR